MTSKILIPVEELWELIRGCLMFPYPQICRHSVAINLLEVIERHGGEVHDELLQAVIQADDEKAMKYLSS